MTRPAARVRSLLASDYCPALIRWNLLRPATRAERLRREAARHSFPSHARLVRAGLIGILFATWPFRALRLIVRHTHRCGGAVARTANVSRLSQVTGQLRLAFNDLLPAHMYYRYELYHRDRDAPSYLHQGDADRLFRRVNRQPHPAVADKAQFHAICGAHGLPAAPILGIAANGTLSMNTEPPPSLFVKPTTGSRGEHTTAWHAAPGGRYRAADGAIREWRDVVALIERQSRERPYLVQPLLQNHPGIADLSSGPLATVRVVTGRSSSGAVECVAAAFRMPATVARDGLFSAIDLDSGVLGRGDSCRLLDAGCDTHPDTGAPITSRTLPPWREARGLAIRAHAMFPGYAFLAWDIALTGDAVVLLEANAFWDVISVQRPHRRSLLETPFADICERHIEANRAHR